MLIKALAHAIQTPLFLKISSCIMGFFVWYIISNSLTITRTVHAPIYFDNKPDTLMLEAPESTEITLCGTRKHMAAAVHNLVLHLDGSRLTHGRYRVYPTYKNFLLPSAIKLLNCMPIEVNNISKTSTEQ